MNIHQKLLEVKKRVPYLQKDKEGHQYRYATPSQVLGTINPILNELGIILKTEVIECTSERVFSKPKSVDLWVSGQKESKIIDVHETMFHLKMLMTWIDVETGDREECQFFSSGINGDEKGLGSALTYAERYFMLKFFNIPTDEDDPDNFQTKHLSKDELEKAEREKFDKMLSGALKDLRGAKTVDELKVIKQKYPTLKSNPAFVDVAKEVFSKMSTEPIKEVVETEANVSGFLKKDADKSTVKDEKPKKSTKKTKEEVDSEVIDSPSIELDTNEPIVEVEVVESEDEDVVENILNEGRNYTTKSSITEWWKSNVGEYESLLLPEEMEKLKKEFSIYYKTLNP